MSWYEKFFKGDRVNREKEQLEEEINKKIIEQTEEDARAVQRLLQQQDLLDEAQKKLKDSE